MINGGEFIVLLVVVALVVGPERLPGYASQLADLVRRARVLLRDTQERVKAEVGEDVDWQALDPRRYDPRRIVREALLEPFEPSGEEQDEKPVSAVMAPVAPAQVFDPSKPVPWDAEAT